MKVYIVSGTSWAGAVTDGSNITVECVGGGGGAKYRDAGGGGEYASSSVAYTSESPVSNIQIGQGGGNQANGTETHWNTDVVIAKPGLTGVYLGGPGGTGGTGDTTYDGGNGGGGNNSGGGGGGGAGGASGAGVNGTSSTSNSGMAGGAGNNNSDGGGTGGTAGGAGAGGAGGNGTNFESTYGSGGGGGGGGHNQPGGNGGLYGGGGGAAGNYSSSGVGKNGIIVITYTPLVAPTVTTQDATDLAATSMTGNGNITATGGANATRRGFCYKVGTSGDPTTSDSVAYDESSYGTGAFTKSITGLTPNTSYRVRAYAVNSAGTGYGTTVTVETLTAFIPKIIWIN